MLPLETRDSRAVSFSTVQLSSNLFKFCQLTHLDTIKVWHSCRRSDMNCYDWQWCGRRRPIKLHGPLKAYVVSVRFVTFWQFCSCALPTLFRGEGRRGHGIARPETVAVYCMDNHLIMDMSFCWQLHYNWTRYSFSLKMRGNNEDTQPYFEYGHNVATDLFV